MWGISLTINPTLDMIQLKPINKGTNVIMINGIYKTVIWT